MDYFDTKRIKFNNNIPIDDELLNKIMEIKRSIDCYNSIIRWICTSYISKYKELSNLIPLLKTDDETNHLLVFEIIYNHYKTNIWTKDN